MFGKATEGAASLAGTRARRKVRIRLLAWASLILPLSAGISTPWAAPAAALPAPLPPTFTVNSISDIVAAAPLDDGICATGYTAGQPNGECTLRAAIMKANHWAGGGATIVFAPQLSGATLSLTILPSGSDDETNGDLNLTATVTLNGGGASSTIIDGNGGVTQDRVFSVGGGVVVTMTGVTIQGGGVVNNDGGGLYNAGYLLLDNSQVISNTSLAPPDGGGGIYNPTGVLTVTNSLIQGNVTPGRGGGIDSGTGSRVTLINSTIAANRAGSDGGGIVNSGATLTVYSSTVNSNMTSQNGGGIVAMGGNTTLVNTTISTNTAIYVGGGLTNYGGTAALINSTVSGNGANTDGGGIWNGCGCSSVTDLFNATVANNQADADFNGSGTGGGIFNLNNVTSKVHFQNSLVDGNYATRFDGVFYVPSPVDCSGPLTSLDYNLVSVTAGCTLTSGPHDQKDVSANLGPLHNNGGPTWTQALLPGSPAIDAANPVACIDNLGATLATDQRGFPRSANGAGTTRCDIGAYEVQRLVNLVNLPLVVR